MAGYGYSNGGYTTYNWTGPRTYESSKTSHAGDRHSDHLCRPVVVDAEGRKMPVSFSPEGSYVTKTETIIEEVRTPLITEYRYGPPARVETQREYGGANSKWGRPLSPVYDRPQKAEEFITRIQTEVGQPTRPTGPLSTIYNHRTRPEFTPHHRTTGFGEYKDHNDKDYTNKDWNKPSNKFARDRHFDDFHHPHAATTETTPITISRIKPSQGTTLSTATNDINKALEYLTETASRPSVVNTATAPIARPRFRVSVPRETINSREPERRYSNFNTSSRPFMSGSDGYTENIDRRGAERRYNGAIV